MNSPPVPLRLGGPKANRRGKNCFSPFLYRDRNAIERMFGRLKDFRRITTDVPLKFHPAAIRASAGFAPVGAISSSA